MGYRCHERLKKTTGVRNWIQKTGYSIKWHAAIRDVKGKLKLVSLIMMKKMNELKVDIGQFSY